MQRINTPAGVTVSYEKYGSGPPLVLVHGAFSDHLTNWEFVAPRFEQEFTVHAIARRGRGNTDATRSHSLEDESADVAAVIRSIAEPVFLLGHSYGAYVALNAAAAVPARVRKLVLYEPATPQLMNQAVLARLEALTEAGDWDGFAATFFHERLRVPLDEVNALRASALWAPIIADAKATLGDLRALSKYKFDAARYRDLRIPVLLQTGTESPSDLYVTNDLAAVLPDVRIQTLEGQAHEGMTTAPELYAEQVRGFLLSTGRPSLQRPQTAVEESA